MHVDSVAGVSCQLPKRPLAATDALCQSGSRGTAAQGQGAVVCVPHHERMSGGDVAG